MLVAQPPIKTLGICRIYDYFPTISYCTAEVKVYGNGLTMEEYYDILAGSLESEDRISVTWTKDTKLEWDYYYDNWQECSEIISCSGAEYVMKVFHRT
jgi:hypothetical protein